ncbi:Protease synthase and sporulation protein PAI 2 [Austwickia sp. TVS 96-490-7B]|uniref:FMN-binding negative transcriptional regulator n=1 Tax=Austwickia sp. TVS 96-490-7B TaxID=2830843 RepID=UPI001C5899BE|nr:FMN-binding negative transcriptional regulator [Austwickia sp. TVS 96-490-7B]MBW3084649.1 Protease synthase and sporulation protein PAI 2 [Austwickia sp. TVS 96-490-7B]
MYIPAHFSMDVPECLQILAGMGAGDFVTVHEHGLDATYLPFELIGAGEDGPAGMHVGPTGSLVAHMARNNPQFRTPVTAPGLVVVHAGDHYVSPGDMPAAQEHGRMVPTWDYVTVQVYGEVIWWDDPVWLAATMSRMTRRHEQQWVGDQRRWWSMDDAPQEFIDRMMRAVVGVQVRIDRVVGKAKMSQNKSPDDVQGHIVALRERGLHDLATYKEEVSLPAAQARRALLAKVAAERARRDKRG